jgi:uncharacterized membrane protein
VDGIGPLQLIVIDFQSAVLPPLVHAQIDDLRRRGLIRLVDSVVAVKGDDGELIILDTLDAPRCDPIWSGVLAQTLFGTMAQPSRIAESMPAADAPIRRAPELGVTEEQLLEVADLIPTNAHALLLLVEHLWTAEIDMAATEAQGHVLASCWISPSLLAHMHQRGDSLFR